MPRLTVAYWNIQNFGRDTPYTRGNGSGEATAFIANVIEQLDADVFFMMEVMPSGEVDLINLQTDLNGGGVVMTPDWSFDFIPAAYTAAATRPVIDIGELTWSCGGSRHEGYAV